MAAPNASITLLQERIRSVDALLKDALASWPKQRDAGPALPATGALITTGTGGSEGPARYLAARLSGCDSRACRFVPSSAFIDGPPLRSAQQATLVVFSQGLSQNARIALKQAPHFARCMVITAVDADGEGEANDYLRALHRQGVSSLQHPPQSESGLLVRVVGPALATLYAELLAAPASAQPRVLDGCRAALAARAARPALPCEVLDPQRDCALITIGDYAPCAHGLRWKLLEGLGEADPPVWDALQLAHGPLQAIYARPSALLVLKSDAQPHADELIERLREVLVEGRHQLHVLAAESPPPLCWFEHDAMLNELLLATLQQRPRDLANWPAKGMDGALYDYAGVE